MRFSTEFSEANYRLDSMEAFDRPAQDDRDMNAVW